MTQYLRLCLLLLLATLGGAGALNAQNSSTLFKYLTPDETGVHFKNPIEETEAFNGVSYTNAYNGSGVSTGDINGDDLPDLFFTGTQAANKLYINKGNFRFEDVTYSSGVADSGSIGRGSMMVDFDADGDLDIYVCRISSPNKLYINDGKGKFTERAKQYGLDYSGHSTQTVFFDYDLDGDLDIYLAISGVAVVDYYARYGINDKLYRNNGNGSYTDVTKQANIVDAGYVMNVLAGDINNDGYPDLYITNDFEANDALYLNNRNGTFTNIKGNAMLHTSFSSMGADMADFNNDGLLDVVAVDMLPRDHEREMYLSSVISVYSPIFDSTQVSRNTLQLNRGNNIFSEIAPFAGVDATEWSWPALFVDFDNDGMKDLFIGNGMKRDITNRDVSYSVSATMSKLELVKTYASNPLSNFMFRNNGDLTFADVSTEWGLDQKSFTNGAAYVDLDLDGDLDLVLNNIDSTAFIYRNLASENSGNNFLRVKLAGSGLNTGGFGARVEIRSGDLYQLIEANPNHGYLSSVDPVLSFGLGKRGSIDSLTVTWPGGAVQKLTGIQANQTITLKQSAATKPSRSARQQNKQQVAGLFTEETKAIAHTHSENAYDDLKRERLLPRRLSENGPGIAVADVNNDGLEDIFLGGAQELTGHLLLQNAAGKFLLSPDSAGIRNDSMAEDMGALFFDADADGDLDLYVVSGGIEFYDDSPELQDRLYLNDGKGRFSKSSGRLPEEVASGSCITAADYDEDGDLDLFVGGRVVPGKYPMPARSLILQNNGGTFRDVTAEVAPALVAPGLICAALWSDFDNDGRVDLVTAGEWMNIRFFRNTGQQNLTASSGGTAPASGIRFEEVLNSGIDSLYGWWNSLTPGDFDNDGDIDYIAGNLGLNWRYKAAPDAPMWIYTTDFDGNGSLDCILTYWDRSYKKEFPMVDRVRMISQIPSIHAKYNTFTSYATATIDEVFGRQRLDTVYTLKVTHFASSYIENLGGGRFRQKDLPNLAQISPLFGSLTEDFDGDGNLDLVLVGNFYDGPEPMVVRYDASCGLYLKGDGKGGFTPLGLDESGIVARGDARGVALVRLGKSTSTTVAAVVANNSGRPQVFKREIAKVGGKLVHVDAKGLGGSEGATHAVIRLKDGRQRRQEFSIGSGYLTQSSRVLVVTPAMESAQFFSGTKLIKEMQF